MDNKVINLSEEKPLVVEDAKEKEMELVDASVFEGIKADTVNKNDLEEIYSLAQEMVKFAHARNGVGLTLPQIGINKRGFVILDRDDQWTMMLNPEYFGNGKKANVYERSLSYDGVYAVQRYKKINATFFTLDVDKNDNLIMKKNYRMMSGLKAFIFQNLVDILNGKTGRVIGTAVKVQEKPEENS